MWPRRQQSAPGLCTMSQAPCWHRQRLDSHGGHTIRPGHTWRMCSLRRYESRAGAGPMQKAWSARRTCLLRLSASLNTATEGMPAWQRSRVATWRRQNRQAAPKHESPHDEVLVAVSVGPLQLDQLRIKRLALHSCHSVGPPSGGQCWQQDQPAHACCLSQVRRQHMTCCC